MKPAILFLLATAFAPAQSILCDLVGAGPNYIRAEGKTELAGDFAIACYGGVAGTELLTDVTLTLTAPITSKALQDGFIEAALLVDEPGLPRVEDGVIRSTPLTPGVTYFSGKLAGPNSVVFRSIPLKVGGTRQAFIRIANLRVDASKVPLTGFPISEGQISATVELSNKSLILFEDRSVVAVSRAPSGTSLSSTDGSPLAFSNCAARNPEFPSSAVQAFTLDFTQSIQWRVRLASTSDPWDRLPGKDYGDESGYYRPELPSTSGMKSAGLATRGTRVSAVFTNVPAGVEIWVATEASGSIHGVSFPLPRIVSSNMYAPDPAVVNPSATVMIGTRPVGVVPVVLVNGQGAITFEATPALMGFQSFGMPVFLKYPAAVSPAVPRVRISYTPFGSTGDIPSFEPTLATDSSFVIRGCNAGLPDLTISSAPSSIVWNGNTTDSVTVVISNKGSADAGPFRVSLDFLSKDIPGLAAGATTTVTLNLPPGPIPGGIDPGFRVDVLGQVVESDETNNFSRLTITKNPALRCTPQDLPSGVITFAGFADGLDLHFRESIYLGSCEASYTLPNVPWISGSPFPPPDFLTSTNRTGQIRTAYAIRENGERIKIVQLPINADQSCQSVVSVRTTSVPALGASGSLNILTPSVDCPWLSVASTDWVHLSPDSGKGAARITYTVDPNFSTLSRTATIRPYGLIRQAGATGTWNERFVQRLYYTFLGRFPTPAELAFQTGELQRGLPPAAMASSFFNSPEFNNSGRFIAGLYVGLLNRDAEYAGWYFQRGAFATSRISQRDLVTNFLNGPEWRLTFGTPDTRAFVRLLYRNILLRDATEPEVDFHAGTISPTGIDRVQFAMNLLNSAEFRNGSGPRLTAFLLYATTLFRDGEPDEVTSTRTKIQGGASAQTLMTDLMKSAEFTWQLR